MPFSGRFMNPSLQPFGGVDEFCSEQQSPRTGDTYKSCLRVFADWLQVHSDMYSTLNSWPLNPRFLTVQMVIAYRKHQAKAQVAKGTIRLRLAAVISYLIWLEGMEMLPNGFDLGRLQRQSRAAGRKLNAAKHIVNYDIPRQRIPEVIDYYDRLTVPQSPSKRIKFLRDRAIVNVLFFTAARVSEVGSINYDQVVDGQKQIIITGKGGKPRTIHIDDKCQNYIQAYLNERDDGFTALFIPHSGNTAAERLSTTSIQRVVKAVFKKMGLHKALSAHDIRHYRATDLLRRGIKLEQLQEYLGHASIATTRDIYAPILGADEIHQVLELMGR